MPQDPSITFRAPSGLINDIEEEMKMGGWNNNISEFIKDAIKFYIRYNREQRVEAAKIKTRIVSEGSD